MIDREDIVLFLMICTIFAMVVLIVVSIREVEEETEDANENLERDMVDDFLNGKYDHRKEDYKKVNIGEFERTLKKRLVLAGRADWEKQIEMQLKREIKALESEIVKIKRKGDKTIHERIMCKNNKKIEKVQEEIEKVKSELSEIREEIREIEEQNKKYMYIMKKIGDEIEKVYIEEIRKI